MDTNGLRTCTKCGETKELTEFSWRNKSKGRLKEQCKTCCSAAQRGYAAANPNILKEYRARNADRLAEWRKQYHEKNREHSLEYSRTYHAKNKDKVKARQTAYVTDQNPGYCAKLLGIPLAYLSQELYEAKRLQILIHRHIKEAA